MNQAAVKSLMTMHPGRSIEDKRHLTAALLNQVRIPFHVQKPPWGVLQSEIMAWFNESQLNILKRHLYTTDALTIVLISFSEEMLHWIVLISPSIKALIFAHSLDPNFVSHTYTKARLPIEFLNVEVANSCRGKCFWVTIFLWMPKF